MQDGNDVDYTLVYQRVANAADAPLSDAPQGGGVKQDLRFPEIIISLFHAIMAEQDTKPSRIQVIDMTTIAPNSGEQRK